MERLALSNKNALRGVATWRFHAAIRSAIQHFLDVPYNVTCRRRRIHVAGSAFRDGSMFRLNRHHATHQPAP